MVIVAKVFPIPLEDHGEFDAALGHVKLYGIVPVQEGLGGQPQLTVNTLNENQRVVC